ncbi:MAG TPA: cytochrome c oxidase subunit I [Thermomicrobiales bacterium]|nr:cytochrome c oxidase subunit I [Thermomicrobiales bacterium]
MASRVSVGPVPVTSEQTFAQPRGVWSWITTVDHKRIGILYLLTALFFFAVGGLEAMLIRVQLARPNSEFMSADTYNQMFTMHGTTMIFLAIMPLSGAFFNFLVPLMIGARDVAFPRLNAFSYWALLFGAIMINVGWLFGEAPDAGWFAYANLTSSAYSPGNNVDFWVLGIQILGLSSLAAAFNFLITIVNMRAPGMGMMRMPIFVWMTLITAILIILAFPALTVGVTMLMLDRFYGSNFFVPEAGGSPLLWQHLFWVFGHPEVYILILPAFGIISEVLPVFSRKPLFGYSAVVFAGAGIAVLGFSVWAHHMFTVGMGPVPNSIFAISTMLIALPTGVKIFNWIGTVWGGHVSLKTPMLFALGLIALFIVGGISGVMHASPPVDSQHQDSYFVVAHFHYVLFGGSIMGLFSGIYYWFPKISGRMYNELMGQIHFWLMFLGMNLTFFPMHWLGVQGMPRRIYTYDDSQGWNDWNMFVTIGMFVLVVSFVFFAANMLMSLVVGERAPDDPWDGATLEWAISSPPPVYNFRTIPLVTSRIPLWSEKYPEVYGGDDHGAHSYEQPDVDDEHGREHMVPGAHGDSHEHEAHDAHGHDDTIHLPNPSYWPLVTAGGIAIAFGGFLVSYIMVGVGVAMTVIGIFAWALEPAITYVAPTTSDDAAHDHHA